ncbi:MAG: hypothetical protein NT146_07560 [Mycobacterium sp.]|nr:hypothetical protein [Mycobacterium sp.]
MIFGLDERAIEDSLHTHRRPSMRRGGDMVSVVFKTVNYVPHESVFAARKIVETGEELVVVGPDVVVAVGHGVHGGLDGLRDELEHRAVPLDIQALYLIKRDVVSLNRAIGPLTRALQTIVTDHQELLPATVAPYLNQLVDQQAEAAEQIGNHDERLSALLQAAHARMDVQQNVDVRKISAWAAMAVAVTTITGICSMNFTEMRWVVGLDYRWGYPAALVFIASFCGFLYVTFRRKHWL